MPLPLSNDERRPARLQAADAPPPPPAGFVEGFLGSFRSARADVPGQEEEWRREAYSPLLDALGEMGYDRTRYSVWQSGAAIGVPSMQETVLYDRVWADVEQARRTKPDAFKGVPATRGDFDRQWQGHMRASIEGNQAVAARAGWAPWLLGGFAGGMTDPVNIATLPLGGGGVGMLRSVGKEMLINGLIEAAEQPLVAAERAAQGRPGLTLGEAATNTVFAAGGAGIITGGMHIGGSLAGRAIAASGLDDAVKKLGDRIAEPLRLRWAERDALRGTPAEDALIADMFEATIGRDNMSELERSTVSVLRREAQVQGASPFAAGGGGAALHNEMMSETFARIFADNPPPGPYSAVVPAPSAADTAAAAPRASGGAGAGRYRTGGSLDGQIVSFFTGRGYSEGQARGIAAGVHAESGSNPAARNPSSGAFGIGQWLGSRKDELFRRYGSNPSIDQQLEFLDWELRGGDHGGAAVRAAGDEAAVLDAYIRKFMRPAEGAETSGDLARGMAALGRKGEAVAAAGTGGRLERAIAANEAEQAAIQAGLDDATARAQDARELTRKAADGGLTVDELADSVNAGTWRGLALPGEIERFAADNADALDAALSRRAAPVEDMPEAVTAILPQLRDIAGDRGRSLNQIDKLAEELGATPQDVRRGLTALAGEGSVTMNRRTGAFMRKPARADENELLETIAKAGGLRDDEGHALGLTGISQRERRELHPAIQRNVKRRRESGGKRDWQRMTRSHGPLLRHEGKSVDAIGELLWERGWFTERPTEAQVLDLIEQRVQSNQPMFPPGYEKSAEASAALTGDDVDEWLAAQAAERDAFRQAWTDFGNDPADLDEDFLYAAVDHYTSGRADLPEHAMAMAIRDEYNAVLSDLVDETQQRLYGDRYDFWHPGQREVAERHLADGGGLARSERLAELARAGGSRGAPDEGAAEAGWADGQRLAELAPEARSPFLDPDSAATKAQADSLEHDARMELGEALDPAIAERQRQQAQLGAEAPMRATEEQDGTIGLGLFDAADQPQFRLTADDDEGGKTTKALLDELDAEAADLKTIKDCL